MSFTVMSPRNSKFSFTTNNFSIRCLWSKLLTSSLLAPSFTVTKRPLGVITCATVKFILVSKRISLLVTIPTKCLPSTTGTPEKLYFVMTASNSLTVKSGVTEIGSFTIPLSNFFTLLTSSA
ncbi:Uncharacterised protein [Legionella pneumophila]|nr:Uncharacterised protein [Legionella pneumophila]